MESLFAVQILLAIAILGSFCSIMLFLIIVMPYCTTNKTWRKYEEEDTVTVCDLSISDQSEEEWTIV